MRLDAFDPHSAYRILDAQLPEDDLEGHMRLAVFAAENELLEPARQELAETRRLADELGKGEDIEERIEAEGQRVLKMLIHRSLQNDRVARAHYYLSRLLIVFPDMPREEKEKLLDEVTKAHAVEAGIDPKSFLEPIGQAKAEEMAEVFDPLRRKLTIAFEYNQDGLRESPGGSEAADEFERATKAYESIRRDLGRLRREHDNDFHYRITLDRLDSQAIEGMVQAELNLGSLSLIRGQMNDATGHVNKALVLDPGNDQALAMRSRIELAANQDGYGVYGWRAVDPRLPKDSGTSRRR
ncbi:MAG: hypothetical protein R3F30_13240 [Planctomycetota bacterium]